MPATKPKRLLTVGLLSVMAGTAYAAGVTEDALREELLKMRLHDQEGQTIAITGDVSKWFDVDSMADYAKQFKESCANPHTVLHGIPDGRRTVPTPQGKAAQ